LPSTEILSPASVFKSTLFRSGSTEYVYVNGQLLATYNVGMESWTDMIYAGGQYIAEVSGTQSATQ